MMSSDLDARRRKLEEAKIALEEEEIELKRQKVARERAAMDQSVSTSSVVQLNVGGECFDTTLDTIGMGGLDSMLMRFVGEGSHGMSGATRDRSGRIFIDRDPDVFKQLLRWLRGQPLTLDTISRGQLLAEAEYFQLHRLKYQLLDEYDPYTLAPADQKIRYTRREAVDNLRARRDGAVESAEALLIDVLAHIDGFVYRGDDGLAVGTASLPRLFGGFQRERGREVGAPLNASLELAAEDAASTAGREASARIRAEPRPSTSFAVSSEVSLAARTAAAEHAASEAARASALRSGYEKRLHLLAGPLLEGLDMTGLCIAGGAVLRALMMGAPTEEDEIEKARKGASDVDFFIVADDESSAQAAFDRLFAHLKARYDVVPNHEYWRQENGEPRLEKDRGDHDDGEPPFRLATDAMLVVRSRFAVTFAAGWPQRHIQVILRRYSCVADVLLQFDIDCCQFAYSGGRVWATLAAQRALVSGVLVADPEWRSRT